MRYLTRDKIYKRIEPAKSAKKIYILCEGAKTETGYFRFFQNFSSNIDIIPIPPIQGHTDPLKLMERANELFYQPESDQSRIPDKLFGDEVWFVFDTDDWNNSGKIKTLREFIEAKNTDANPCRAAQSNPSFEVWLYYHFYAEAAPPPEVKKFLSLKEFGLNKIPGGFDNRKHPILIKAAELNARSNFKVINNQPDYFCTEVFQLASLILKFTSQELVIARSEIQTE